MNGLALSRRYYEAYGKPLLEERFPALSPYIAAGLAGSGSECLGFDDAISEDHDFGPCFCLWLPDESLISRKDAFALERAYASLPSSFEGYARPRLAPVGGARTGVIRFSDFFLEKTGSSDGVLTAMEWLKIPMPSLGEAVNGAVFCDPLGQFSRIRGALSHMPDDIRRKRMAGHLLLMAQSGQYNYQRCLDHGEEAGAQLAAFSFVQNAISADPRPRGGRRCAACRDRIRKGGDGGGLPFEPAVQAVLQMGVPGASGTAGPLRACADPFRDHPNAERPGNELSEVFADRDRLRGDHWDADGRGAYECLLRRSRKTRLFGK